MRGILFSDSRHLILYIFLLSLNFSCAHSADKASQLKPNRKASLHQVRSSELREKMKSMNALMFEYELDELRYDEQRTRQAARIAEIAGSMSDAMHQSSVKQELGLNTRYAPKFFQLAQRLKIQALALNKAAQLQQTEEYSRLFRSMVETCNECHSKFRGMS